MNITDLKIENGIYIDDTLASFVTYVLIIKNGRMKLWWFNEWVGEIEDDIRIDDVGQYGTRIEFKSKKEKSYSSIPLTDKDGNILTNWKKSSDC